jgi:hypothetical protein
MRRNNRCERSGVKQLLNPALDRRSAQTGQLLARKGKLHVDVKGDRVYAVTGTGHVYALKHPVVR